MPPKIPELDLSKLSSGAVMIGSPLDVTEKELETSMNHGSITPRTHKERVLLYESSTDTVDRADAVPEQVTSESYTAEPAVGERAATSLPTVPQPASHERETATAGLSLGEVYTGTFIDVFSNEKQTVLRFGIDHGSREVMGYVQVYNASTDKTEQSGDLSSGKQRRKSHEGILKFSSDNITVLERNLILQAIKWLDSNKHVSVVVDIFARKEKQINLNNNVPETHSVTLYHNKTQNKIFIIDPNNSLFSHILVSIDTRLCYVIEELRIYEVPKDKTTGRNNDEWRDCTDIAVKLAFGFVKNDGTKFSDVIETKDRLIVLNSLENSLTLRTVSNNCNFYKFLSTIVENESIRARQGSDLILAEYITYFIDRVSYIYIYVINILNKLTFNPMHTRAFLTHLVLELSENFNNPDDIDSLKNKVSSIEKQIKSVPNTADEILDYEQGLIGELTRTQIEQELGVL